MNSRILKRKLDPAMFPEPEKKPDPEQDDAPNMKWGKMTGDSELPSLKTYGTNPKERKPILQCEGNTLPLKKLTRMQLISCFIQLEEKNYIECPKKGCRCIGLTVPEIADHIDSCKGAKSNDLLNFCKYCPHGTLTTKSLFNHTVVSHPYAYEVTPKDCLQYYDSLYESVKKKYLESEDFKQTIKNHWRIYLESKGCIVCLNPYCHYVTGFISKMEDHFLMCTPEVWDKLTISCSKCVGRTHCEQEMDAHIANCHSRDIMYNRADEKVNEFWESTLQAYEVSKCVMKDCKFISHNILTLQKHFRYCRNPHPENFDVCSLCGGWFDNIVDLWRHETSFHVSGNANKIKKLLNIVVNSSDTSQTSEKISSPPRSQLISSPPVAKTTSTQTSNNCEQHRVKEKVEKKTSFLGELAKIIESESDNSSFIDVKITVENQFSWAMKAPGLDTATNVVNRRLPCYSIKRVMSESIENGARLLKLSKNVVSITNNLEKKYIPPRPLDFALDNPNLFSKFKKNLVIPKPVVPEVISVKSSVQCVKCTETNSNSSHHTEVAECTETNITVRSSEGTYVKEISVKKPENRKKATKQSQKIECKPLLSSEKSYPNENHISPNTVETKVEISKLIKVCNGNRFIAMPTNSLDYKANGSNNLSVSKVALSNDLNPLSPRFVSDPKTSRFIIAPASGDSLLAIRRNWDKILQIKTSPHAPLQYPSPKSRATTPSPFKHIAQVLPRSNDKNQIPSSFKLVRFVSSKELNAIKTATKQTPLQPPPTLVPNPNCLTKSNVVETSKGFQKVSSIGYSKKCNLTALKSENSLDCLERDSSIPFELPNFPPTKSIIFGVSNPISDYYDEMDCRGSSGNSIPPKSRNLYRRTYGRSTKNSQVNKNHLVVENGMVSGNDNSSTHVENGIFDDQMDVDTDHRECVDDPLNVDTNTAEVVVKTERMDDFDYDDPSTIFHENYDIFAGALEKDEGPYDSSIPFDIICESSQAMSGGLYNDRCPWEQVMMKNSSDINLCNFSKENPCKSGRLLENSVFNPHPPSNLFSNNGETLSGGNLDELNHNISVIKSDDSENCKELVNYLTNANGTRFVNEPMIYTIFNTIHTDHPELIDSESNRTKDPTDIPSVQKCSLVEKERSSSRSKNNLDEPNFISRCNWDKADSTKEFQDLVNYLTNYNRFKLFNEQTVYAVDRVITDNPTNITDRRKNGTESKKAVSLPSIPGCSRNSPSELPMGNSNHACQPTDLSKPVEKGSEKVNQLPTSKRKRKSCSPRISKGLSDTQASDNVEPSFEETGVSDVRSVHDSAEKNESLGVSSLDNVTSQDSSNDIPCRSTDSERLGNSDHSEDPLVSNNISGRRRTARRTTQIADLAYEEHEAFKTTRRKRSSRKIINVPPVEEISPGVIVPLPQKGSEEVKLPIPRGRPPKRKSAPILAGCNVPRSAFSRESDDPPPNPDSVLLYLDNKEPNNEELVPADRRLIFSSPLVDPHKLVECAVCSETMTAGVYKKEHVIKHNHLCWLKGEEPMDLEDEKGMERFLYRIYLKTRAPFVCEICKVKKKSAAGFISHRKFCGKSLQERQELMVSCTICTRLLLPSSLHIHMVKTHPALANTPEEPPLEARPAASKCLDTLSTAAKDIINDQEFIDENEELMAVEKDAWIRQVYSFCPRRIQKVQKSIIEATAQGSQNYSCMFPDCDFSGKNIQNVIEHCRICDKEPLDSKCKECSFLTNSEPRMINHVRMTHFDKAKEYSSMDRSYECIDVSEVTGEFIPYIKAGELSGRSMLYLQSALYWTRDLRAEHFSTDPLFTDLTVVTNLDLKTVEELSSYIKLRDESIRIKAKEDTPEWSVLQKFASESFSDDVRILYTGGVVRCFDWFPSSESQYLAVGIGPFDSERISDVPISAGPGHFQIWSVGTLDNFSESYNVDLKFHSAICHEFGEIWDIECCPSGARTLERLGLVATATSSGIVAVYSIPMTLTSYEKRAIKLDPVLTLKLGTKDSYQVSRISWSKTSPHRFIAAGFTNGLVAVWDITTSSTLLRSGNTLFPFKMFHPHLTIISALSFSPVNEYYLATGCTEKSCKFWNLHDTSVNHGEFTRGLVTDLAWLPLWLSAVCTLDDNYTTGTTTVTLNPIRNFIYQSQPGVTQADSAAMSVSVNNWLNTYVCGYDSGQIILSIARKYSQHVNDDRRKVFNCLLYPQLHDFDPYSSKTVGCRSYSSVCERYGIVFNHNFRISTQTKIKGNPCNDLLLFPLTPVNKVSWNPNPNSFLTLASGFHSGFIIVSRMKLPTNETNLLKSVVESLNNHVPS